MKRRTVLKIVAAVLALLGALACGEGKPQGPGETRCVDKDGHRTACPKQW